MQLIKKILFKNLIFFLSFFFKVNRSNWIISLLDGGGSSTAENCLEFAKFLKKKKVNFYIIAKKKIKGLSKNVVSPYTLKYFKALLFSKYLIVENDLHDDIPAYRELDTFKVNLFHGLALKKIYYSSKNVRTIFQKNLKNIFKKTLTGFCYPEEYNLIITTNKLHQKKYKEAFKNKNVKIFSQPRNVNLLKIKDNNSYQNFLKRKFNLSKNKKIILYLPTFRDTDKTGYVSDLEYNMNDFNAFLKKNNLQFIIKKHNFYNSNLLNFKKFPKNNRSFFLDFSKKNCLTQDLLAVADILITDYSGIYFDYLLTEKPVIFYCYDYKKYISHDRELYFDYFDKLVTPGPKAYDYKELKKFINYFLVREKNYYSNYLKAVKNKFYPSPSSSCNEDLYNYIIKHS